MGMNRQAKRYWLARVRPYRLRELMYWKLFYRSRSYGEYRLASRAHLFENAPLEFAPRVSLKLLPTDLGHQEIAYCGYYELSVSRQIARLAQAGGLMVDVGANFGYYSCLWAAARSDNRVIAFEASPRNVPYLRGNVINNGLDAQVDVHGLAVGKEKGRLPFALGPDDQSGDGGLVLSEKVDTVVVPVVSLDDFFLGPHGAGFQSKIDVLKIDTEGADTWVLQGAEKLLRLGRIRNIFFEELECHMAPLGLRPGDAEDLLRGCGYQLKKISGVEWYATLSSVDE